MQQTAAAADSPNWIVNAYNGLDGIFGIDKFNQAVPLIISAIAVGTTLVNRNFPKCIGHIIGATLFSFLSYAIITNQSGTQCNQFTTAFLWYSIVYVAGCMYNSDNVDSNSLIGIALGFIFLVYIDFVTFMGGMCSSVSGKNYTLIILISMIGGIVGVSIVRSMSKSALYDFKGCSCDDCAAADKCRSGTQTTMMMKKIASQRN
jgi:hypothetical protein